MKKLIALFSIVGICGLYSCQKECTCTNTIGVGAAAVSSQTTLTTTGRCSALDKETTTGGVTTRTECR